MMEPVKPWTNNNPQLYKRAQRELELTFLDGNTQMLVDYHAKTAGVCKEYVLLPLLSAVTGCMNNNTDIRISPHWVERVSIWSLVGARRGERKTTVMRRFKMAFDQLHSEAKQAPSFRNIPGTETSKVMLDEFSLRDVDVNAKLACQTDNNVVMLDDFGLFIRSVKNQNGKYSNLLQNTSMDASLLNLFFDGGCSSDDGPVSPRDSLSRDLNVHIPQFNVSFAGFIDAADMEAFVDNHSINGNFSSCMDRLLICCPRDSMSSDLDSSVAPCKASILDVLSTVKNVHKVNKTSYIFSSEGQAEFDRMTRHYTDMKNQVEDERCRGSLGKAPGLLARISAALTALRNGVYLSIHGLSPSPTVVPSPVISMATVIAANAILTHTLEQKFMLFGEEMSLQMHSEESQTVWPDKEGVVNLTTGSRPKGKPIKRPASKSPTDSIKQRLENSQQTQLLIQNVCSLTETRSIKRERQTPTFEDNDVNFKTPKFDDRVLVFDTGCMERNVDVPSYSDDDRPVSSNQLVGEAIEIDDDSVESATSSVSLRTGGMRLRVTPAKENSDDKESRDINSLGSANKHKSRKQYNEKTEESDENSFTDGYEAVAVDYNSSFSEKITPPEQIQWEPASSAERTTRFGMLERPTDQKIALEELSDEDFVLLCKPKIKKFLMHPQLQISCGHACQRRLFPGVPKHLRLGSQSTSHPGWAALLFFNRLEDLGLGYVWKRGGSFKAPQFMKYSITEMSTEARNVLKKAGISEEEYENEYPTWCAAPTPPQPRAEEKPGYRPIAMKPPNCYDVNGTPVVFQVEPN